MVQRRKIGNLDVAPIALGGNVFGWTADEATSFQILDAFVDAGGTMIDTADVYSKWAPGHSGGESETVIGKWLKRDPSKKDRVLIATKVGMMSGLTPNEISNACEGSLKRLGVDRIGLYYQHKDDEKVPLEDSLGEFERLKNDGKICAIGLSNFSGQRIDEAFAVVERCGFERPIALQPQYNLVARDYETQLRPAAQRHGLGVFPYHGLASGFLTGKYRSRDDIGKSTRGDTVVQYLDQRGMNVLDTLDDIARDTGSALATIALSWLMAQPTIIAPLASATRLEQLGEVTAAMDLTLTADQIQRLDRAGAPAEREPA